MIKKFSRFGPQYTNSIQRFIEFIFGEYLLYLSIWKAYDPIEDEFNYRKSFWVSLITLFSIIFLITIFTAAIVVIIKL